MQTTESILFLLGTEMATELPEDYRLEADPSAVVSDLRDSDLPPPPSTRSDGPPSSRGGPPSSRGAPPSSRSRGAHVPSVFDVVEFGVHSPRTASALAQHDDAADFGAVLGTYTPNATEIREAIGNIAVDDRDGPASNRIAVQERIQNRIRIRDLANTLVRYRSIGILNSAFKAPVQVRAAAFYRQAHAMCWELSGPWIEPPFVLEVGGYNSVYQIPVEAASMRDGLMLTPLPREVVRLRRRWGRRVRAPEGCTIALPGEDDETPRQRTVRDMSFTGLSFWNEDGDLVHPGTEVKGTELSLAGERPVRVAGEISFVARDVGGRGDLCGMRLQIDDAGDRERWREFVARSLYPTTRSGAGHYEAIWRLYQEAGYFNLSGKDPDHFAQLKACFFRNSECIDQTPDLGCTVVWPVQDEVMATISMLKIYRGSWFVYQLAKLRGDAPDGTSSRQVLRDVHLRAYEHAQLDPSLRWLIGYPQVKQIWSRAVHHDLPRRFTTAGLACVVRFRALEVPCNAPPAGGAGEYEIGRATPEEVKAFLGWLAEARPRPYTEAYDLTPERIDLAENKQTWQDANMARDREIRVARRNGRMLAVAILEDAAEGLHLFRLLDVVRPFPMVKDVTVAAPAIDALVDSAKAWYRSKGKQSFCTFIEEDSWLTPAMMGTVDDMGLADMTILSAQLLPEMLEHLIEVTAPRE